MKSSQRIVIGLSLMTCIIFGGTVSATYAWFQLNQDKQIQFSGTSFGKSADLQLGFVSDIPLSFEGLTYSEEDSQKEGKNIYWVESNIASSEMVKYIVTSNGYAGDNMFPVTSGKYQSGDAFKLYNAPVYGCSFDSSVTKAADKDSYFHISFAFKVTGGENSTSDSPVEGSKVFLSDYQLSGSAKDAVRLHINSSSVTYGSVSSVVKPTSSEDGLTYVGGQLDLDQDGEFDYFSSAEDPSKKEFFYGQKNSDVTYGEAYSETVNDGLRNINCFKNPNKTQGVLPLSQVDSYASTASYSSLDAYKYKGDGEDNSLVTPMCITDVNGIGFVDLDIYLEGWDHSLINQVIGSYLGTSMSFVNGNEE